MTPFALFAWLIFPAFASPTPTGDGGSVLRALEIENRTISAYRERWLSLDPPSDNAELARQRILSVQLAFRLRMLSQLGVLQESTTPAAVAKWWDIYARTTDAILQDMNGLFDGAIAGHHRLLLLEERIRYATRLGIGEGLVYGDRLEVWLEKLVHDEHDEVAEVIRDMSEYSERRPLLRAPPETESHGRSVQAIVERLFKPIDGGSSLVRRLLNVDSGLEPVIQALAKQVHGGLANQGWGDELDRELEEIIAAELYEKLRALPEGTSAPDFVPAVQQLLDEYAELEKYDLRFFRRILVEEKHWKRIEWDVRGWLSDAVEAKIKDWSGLYEKDAEGLSIQTMQGAPRIVQVDLSRTPSDLKSSQSRLQPTELKLAGGLDLFPPGEYVLELEVELLPGNTKRRLFFCVRVPAGGEPLGVARVSFPKVLLSGFMPVADPKDSGSPGDLFGERPISHREVWEAIHRYASNQMGVSDHVDNLQVCVRNLVEKTSTRELALDVSAFEAPMKAGDLRSRIESIRDQVRISPLRDEAWSIPVANREELDKLKWDLPLLFTILEPEISSAMAPGCFCLAEKPDWAPLYVDRGNPYRLPADRSLWAGPTDDPIPVESAEEGGPNGTVFYLMLTH